MQCPKCGFSNSDEYTNCQNCGAELTGSPGTPEQKKTSEDPANPKAGNAGNAGNESGALQCSKCGSTAITRATKTIGSGEDAEKVSIARCRSCGAVYDKDSAIYYRFYASRFQPRGADSALKIGLKGKLKDLEYEILGRIRYQEEDEYNIATWDEWYIISQYGDRQWLVVEEGKFFLYSKYRPKKELTVNSSGAVLDGKKIPASKGYNARIVFTEGQLPWDAPIGEKALCYDFKMDGKRLSIEKTESEVEVYDSERIKALDLFEGFQLKDYIERYKRSIAKRKVFARKARLYVLLGLGFFIWTIFNCSSGQTVFHFSPVKDLVKPPRVKQNGYMLYKLDTDAPDQKAISDNFRVQHLKLNQVKLGPLALSNTGTIHSIILRSQQLKLEWLETYASLLRNDKEVFGLKASFWHEEGYDSDGRWSESDLKGDAEFVLENAGQYYLYLEIDAKYKNRGWPWVSVEITAGEKSYTFLLIASLLFLFIGAIAWARSASYSDFPFKVVFDE